MWIMKLENDKKVEFAMQRAAEHYANSLRTNGHKVSGPYYEPNQKRTVASKLPGQRPLQGKPDKVRW